MPAPRSGSRVSVALRYGGWIAAAAVLALWKAAPTSMAATVRVDPATIYGALASAGVSLLGFVLTAMSVVMTAAPTAPQFKAVRESPAMKGLLDAFIVAMCWLGALSLAAFLAMIYDQVGWPSACAAVVLALSAASVVALVRTVVLFRQSVLLLSIPPGIPDPAPFPDDQADEPSSSPMTAPPDNKPAAAKKNGKRSRGNR